MKHIIATILCLLITFAAFSQTDSTGHITDSIFAKNDTVSEQPDSSTLVYKFNIKEQITPSTWRKTQKVFENAQKMNADLILIHMNTYGGTVVDADSIRTKILNSNIPVWVYIDNNAASAGALISIACDSIFMRPGANIGAATVVNQSGEKAGDKMQSYFRSIMRSTAQSHGADTIITATDTTIQWFRNPQIAEAMVDEYVSIPGIIDTGKVLTLTAEEAYDLNFCEGIVDNIEELLIKANINTYKIEEFVPTTIDKIIGLLTNPFVSGLLIMAIIGGIYFEMQTPGVGFPLAIALLAAVLYFAPLYLEGLAEHWEILVFVAGIILIAVEIFVIPGFGVAGALGIALTITGLTLSLIDNVRFNFEMVDGGSIISAILTVTLSLFLGLILVLFLSKMAFSAQQGIFHNLSLNSTQQTSEGYISFDTHQFSLDGKKGIAHTVLRPSGKVLVDDEVWDAKSTEGFIDRGEKILVVRHESGQLYVEKDEENEE